MNFDQLCFDEDVPSFGGLGVKRDRDNDTDESECEFESAVKKISYVLDPHDVCLFSGCEAPLSPLDKPVSQVEELLPYPFYGYRDHSRDADPDPLTPLTAPGRVPNFPAKMQAILSRKDLEDLISWMPHGRSWRVLKPREFEVRVIPTYFEHAKFSSFIRQANGWGFRRITQGPDKNSYYHPLFLRGLPHLCKLMKRPGVSEKQSFVPDQEPDLQKISEVYPVPEKMEDESILLKSTIQGGPKARVPIYSVSSLQIESKLPVSGKAAPKLTPSDQQAIAAFEQSLGASESQLTKVKAKATSVSRSKVQSVTSSSLNVSSPAPMMMNMPMNMFKTNSPLEIANQLAFSFPSMGMEFDADSAAAQFAAGFAAATAISQKRFEAALVSLQQQGLIPQQMEQVPERDTSFFPTDFQGDFNLDELAASTTYWQ